MPKADPPPRPAALAAKRRGGQAEVSNTRTLVTEEPKIFRRIRSSRRFCPKGRNAMGPKKAVTYQLTANNFDQYYHISISRQPNCQYNNGTSSYYKLK